MRRNEEILHEFLIKNLYNQNKVCYFVSEFETKRITLFKSKIIN